METKFLFLIVIFSQLILISYYFPRKIGGRILYLINNYPSSEFPKLYPKSNEYYTKILSNYNFLNSFILALGLVLLGIVFANFPENSQRERWDQVIVFAFFMVQFFPILFLEISSFNIFRQMRKTDSRSIRKAELQPRRLFDFISPILLGIVIFVYVAFIIFILYFKRFNYSWFGGNMNIIISTGAYILFIVIAVWNIYGKKLDPFQSFKDRRRQISLIVNQLAFISIGMILYTTFSIVAHAYELRYLESIFMSIYFQLIAIVSFRNIQMEDINFEVYKEEPQVS